MAAIPHVESYYAASGNPAPEHPELEGDVEADVCVVGAGFTGLSAALELALRGYRVVVLEGARVGWGASGRNGGQICSGYSPGMDRVAEWVGPDDALRLWRVAEEAKDIIALRVARHRIACDLKPGYLHVAAKPRQMHGMRAELELWRGRYGYAKARLVEVAELRDMLETRAYVGGVLDTGAGHLHPLNYCLGLADAALQAGARIFEGSRATRLDTGAMPSAETAGGRVRARFLALCGNADLGWLVPKIRRKIMPAGTYVAATRPLGAERARRLIRDDVAVADANFVLNYFRLSADHRLLFGGRVSYSTLMPANLPAAMRRSMLAIYPQLADAPFDYVWGGSVAITMERTPHLGRLTPTVFFAHGVSGMGVALSGVAGRILSEAIAGQAERLDLFARLPHSTFPGGRWLSTPTLALAMAWYRLRDML